MLSNEELLTIAEKLNSNHLHNFVYEILDLIHILLTHYGQQSGNYMELVSLILYNKEDSVMLIVYYVA